MHNPLTWEKQQAEINDFIEKYIYANIYETELKERSMLSWLETLPLHSYDARRDEEPSKSGTAADKDDNEE